MYFSRARLHPPVIRSAGHMRIVKSAYSTLVPRRRSLIRTLKSRFMALVSPPTYVELPVATVSLNSNFDAVIDICYKGAPSSAVVSMIVDSGNSMLIVPRWEDIQALPNSNADYQVLGQCKEPWGCPVNVVRGPINITTTTGGVYTIENCVFYACTDGPAPGEDRTANFGAGCLSPWTASVWNTPAGVGVTMQAPLSYDSSNPFLEFNYAPAAQTHGAVGMPNVTDSSSLRLYTTMPPGYQMFDIIGDLEWMSLTPLSLIIGGVKTQWPGVVPSPLIAMIDTGGGPVHLSDPNGIVCDANWPDPVANPSWTSTSIDCQSTGEAVGLQLGDANGSFSYTIDTSKLPSTVQGMTLVMCKLNYFMMGRQGLNIGGISALENYILVDYARHQVGFKAK
jgi:hypothetical protein